MRKRFIDKHIRLTYEEEKKLKSLSEKTKKSENEIICSLLKNVKLREAPDKDFFIYLNKIDKIGVNINQLAKIANATGVIYENELHKQFDKMNSFIETIKEKYIR